jgi:MATE family multidrug resistance protein
MSRSVHTTADAVRTPWLVELGPLLRLAGPVVTAELGWMTMWLVDVMLVGRVNAEAIGAVSIGGHLFYTIAIFGMGMLLGLDYVVASAFGAGRHADARRALFDGLWLAAALTVALTVVVYAAVPLLGATGIRPSVLRDAIPYLQAMTWSLLPLFMFVALRRYLQAIGLVTPIMLTILAANLVNAAAGWTFIFGHLGAPALGAVGAGWATCFARFFMFGSLAIYLGARERRTRAPRVPLRPDWTRIARLVRLGLPAALQLTLEIGVFGVATLLAGRLEAAALAAHQIALSMAGLSFMVPLGISSAAAVRVGQAVGRHDPDAARRAGWTALAVGAGFMSCAGVAFVVAPRILMRVFTTDAGVIATGRSLLLVAACFQLFDGVQVVATGALRGTGDTRTPMLANLLGHWALGLPVGCWLCFRLGWGIVGMWCGLSLGLVAVAIALLAVWTRRTRRRDAGSPSEWRSAGALSTSAGA